MDDFSLSLLASILSDNVIKPYFRAIAISRHRHLPLGKLVCNLRRHDLSRIAVLVQHYKGFSRRP